MILSSDEEDKDRLNQEMYKSIVDAIEKTKKQKENTNNKNIVQKIFREEVDIVPILIKDSKTTKPFKS